MGCCGPIAEMIYAATTKPIVTAIAIEAGDGGFRKPSAFKYRMTDAAVMRLAATMNVTPALGLRVAKSLRETTAEITYGIHATEVTRIAVISP